jgi:hypothetical protein
MEPSAAGEKSPPEFECCGLGADAAVPCRVTALILGKHHRLRIRFGEERPLRSAEEYCPECGTPRRGVHHVGCSLEQCPRCQAQLAACGCPRSIAPAPGPDDERPAATALVFAPDAFPQPAAPPRRRSNSRLHTLARSPQVRQAALLVCLVLGASIGFWLLQVAQREPPHGSPNGSDQGSVRAPVRVASW